MIRKKNGKGEMHSLALLLNNMEKGALGTHSTRPIYVGAYGMRSCTPSEWHSHLSSPLPKQGEEVNNGIFKIYW